VLQQTTKSLIDEDCSSAVWSAGAARCSRGPGRRGSDERAVIVRRARGRSASARRAIWAIVVEVGPPDPVPRYFELAENLKTTNEFRHGRGTGEERLGRINAMIRMASWTASSFLPHPIRTQRSTRNPTTSGRPRARRRLWGGDGRNDEVLAEPEW